MKLNMTGLPCLFVGVHFQYTLTHIGLPISDSFRLFRAMSSGCVTIDLPIDSGDSLVVVLCSICLYVKRKDIYD